MAGGGPIVERSEERLVEGAGVIAAGRNDGSFTAPPMLGNDKDQVLIYYKTPFGDYSDSLCVLLGTAASTCE